MYIRTKDGVYKVSHYNDWATHKRKGATLIDGYKNSYIKNENIINQSENLEELCDTYVFVGGDKDYNSNPLLWNIKQDIPFLMKYYFKHNIIYGAIWTSKGLIYVAKMNEKGELELI